MSLAELEQSLIQAMETFEIFDCREHSEAQALSLAHRWLWDNPRELYRPEP